MKNAESKLQQACVMWFRHQYRDKILYAIPNGGARDAITGAILKKEGVLAGVADLFLSCPNGQFHGLYIEMKQATGNQTPEQRAFQKFVVEVGYNYVVCRSIDDFMGVVNNYLDDAIVNEN